MRRKPHVRFLGGGDVAIPPRYPTDTVGEFVRALHLRVSTPLEEPILPKLWMISGGWEFASSMQCYSRPGHPRTAGPEEETRARGTSPRPGPRPPCPSWPASPGTCRP